MVPLVRCIQYKQEYNVTIRKGFSRRFGGLDNTVVELTKDLVAEFLCLFLIDKTTHEYALNL